MLSQVMPSYYQHNSKMPYKSWPLPMLLASHEMKKMIENENIMKINNLYFVFFLRNF
jgi:hypothetical protein